MNVAVLGVGASALATAAELALGGHRVRLWAASSPELAPIQSAGGIRLNGKTGSGTAKLETLSTDLAGCLDAADLVLAAVPARAQAELAKALAPVLSERQILMATAGALGSYVIAREVAGVGGRLPFAVVEASTPPHHASGHGPAEVTVRAQPTVLPVGVFPAVRSPEVVARIHEAFPTAEARADALDACLIDGHAVLGPALALLSAGGLSRGPVDLRGTDGSPLARRLIEALDAERVAAREALGYAPPHYEKASYLREGADLSEPLTLESSYLTQDATLGLGLIESAARTTGTDSPAASGVLSSMSALLGRDLRATGRALDTLGLGDFTQREVLDFFHGGWFSPLWSRVLPSPTRRFRPFGL